MKTAERLELSGEVFEAIIMLRYNCRFWTDKFELIAETVDMVANERRNEQATKLMVAAREAAEVITE